MLLLLLSLPMLGCKKDDHVFKQRPAERNQEALAKLQTELTKAPHGWYMYYFPRTDSLLYSSPQTIIAESEASGSRRNLQRNAFGGFLFKLAFAPDGQVEVRAAASEQSISAAQKVGYSLANNTSAQLSFTTHSPIHQLINNRFRGVSDFLYDGPDSVGNLVFKSGRKLEPAQEHIVLRRVEENHQDGRDLQQALANRQHFEAMELPNLRISIGDKLYFLSDPETSYRAINDFAQVFLGNRYHLFRANATPHVDAAVDPKRAKCQLLGSGYVPTPTGLFFYPGLRLSHTIVFYEFKRVGDRFEAEYVDPRGLNPTYRAVIWDNK